MNGDEDGAGLSSAPSQSAVSFLPQSTSNGTSTHGSAIDSRTVERALAQNLGVQEKVEECAEDLAASNEDMQQLLDDGATMVLASTVLADAQDVESVVQDCAADLTEVNAALAEGLEELKLLEGSLLTARSALAVTEAALVLAREEIEEARHLALHDVVTGLPNRTLFNDRLQHALSLAERRRWALAVMFLDLNGFKLVNDEHGHAAGDEVLRVLGERLRRHTREEDSVCRYGGDEFLMLFINPSNKSAIEQMALGLVKTLAAPIPFGAASLAIKSCVGVALFPESGLTTKALIENADEAMYRAKKQKLDFAFH